MNKKEALRKIKTIIDILDGIIGDTDPDVSDLTEDEIIEYEPNYWLMHQIMDLDNYVKSVK